METIKLKYEIPNSIDPKIFGPAAWGSLHDIVSKLPCSICKDEAISFMRFYHDLKNYQLGKKIEYKENFIEWINAISKLKQKPLILK